jgi:hypothetical protein
MLYIQNKIIRIMTVLRKSKPVIIMKFNIPMLTSEFLFLTLSFVVHHMVEFETNSDVKNISRGRRYGMCWVLMSVDMKRS